MNQNDQEIIVQLHYLGLRLWQRRDFFGFTEDSHLLAEFVGERPACRKICDLGSGSGGLLFLVWAKNRQAECCGLEIMAQNVELAERSRQLNAAVPGLLANCRFQQGDWRTPQLYFPPASFDLLVSNPPYQPPGRGRLSPVLERAAARTELFGGLPELLSAASWLLKSKAKETGRLALVLPQARQNELLGLLDEKGFQLKREQTHRQLWLIELQKI